MTDKYNVPTFQRSNVPTSTAPLGVRLEGIYKSFPQDGGRLDVLRDISMDVPAGAFVSVVGPSGSGKSTLLAILAGLDEPDRGTVTLQPNGVVGLGVGQARAQQAAPLPERLGQVGYMPQRDLLLPWRTALDNATAALEVQGMDKVEARKHALPLFKEFGLDGFAGNYPHELSGGMRQRVSFLRSAIMARGLMLLDEPFGGLDALTRASMQEWLMEAASHLGSTFVLVTHDVDEAVLLSDRVYVLSPRPARVVLSLDIDMPRPRDVQTFKRSNVQTFTDYSQRLLDALRSAGGLEASVEQGRRK